MEVMTDEDWMMAVIMVPKSTNNSGLRMEARKSLTESSAANSSMAFAIILRPTKSIPKPVRIPPVFFHASLLANSIIKAPIPAKAAKRTVVERLLEPERPSATNWAVTVVPMFAP